MYFAPALCSVLSCQNRCNHRLHKAGKAPLLDVTTLLFLPSWSSFSPPRTSKPQGLFHSSVLNIVWALQQKHTSHLHIGESLQSWEYKLIHTEAAKEKVIVHHISKECQSSDILRTLYNVVCTGHPHLLKLHFSWINTVNLSKCSMPVGLTYSSGMTDWS